VEKLPGALYGTTPASLKPKAHSPCKAVISNVNYAQTSVSETILHFLPSGVVPRRTLQGFNAETLIIYKLSSRKFATHNDIY
jgi:hypothetical protein